MPNAGQTPARCQKETGIHGDTELLTRFKNDRDESAFAEFVERHASMVLGICRRLLGNRADAEDAFQATFFVLAMRLRRQKPPSLPANWLYVVAKRTALKANSAKWRMEARLRRIAEMKTNEPRAQEELAGMSLPIWARCCPMRMEMHAYSSVPKMKPRRPFLGSRALIGSTPIRQLSILAAQK